MMTLLSEVWREMYLATVREPPLMMAEVLLWLPQMFGAGISFSPSWRGTERKVSGDCQEIREMRRPSLRRRRADEKSQQLSADMSSLVILAGVVSGEGGSVARGVATVVSYQFPILTSLSEIGEGEAKEMPRSLSFRLRDSAILFRAIRGNLGTFRGCTCLLLMGFSFIFWRY